MWNENRATPIGESLEALASELGVEVEFVDSYLAEEELHDLVADSDVVLIPYDNRQQISSGVLVDALAAGRPVVATNFPHARELLRDGAGIVVDHDDSEQMTTALRRLLTDDCCLSKERGSSPGGKNQTQLGRRRSALSRLD